MEFLSPLTIISDKQPLLIEKRIQLLQEIDKVGSISKAAKLVPMSYKSAWDAVDAINNLSPEIIVSKETGGKGGGGATLTPYGKNFLQTYIFLQKEHEKFLSQITKMTDFDKGVLKSIKRLNMQISARNQIQGTIEFLQKDRINASIGIKLKSGTLLVSMITNEATNALNLSVGDDVVAIFKSTNVLLSPSSDLKISARNAIDGVIENITKENVNSEVIVNIGDDEKITAVITSDAIDQLDLKNGDSITAIIKSNDVMVGI